MEVTAILVVLGVATFYYPLEYSSPPVLYCGMEAPNTPWVAVDVAFYQEGRIRCGDTLLVEVEGAAPFLALALDAGPFGRYYVEDWPELPIVVDIPRQFWPLDTMSAPVQVINKSTLYRLAEERIPR